MSALIYCPFPDPECAESVGRQLIEAGLIACINIGPQVRSVFAWEGVVDTADEVPCLFKTSATRLEDAIALLEDLHPYDTPAIMGWHCDAVGAATRHWLGAL